MFKQKKSTLIAVQDLLLSVQLKKHRKVNLINREFSTIESSIVFFYIFRLHISLQKAVHKINSQTVSFQN